MTEGCGTEFGDLRMRKWQSAELDRVKWREISEEIKVILRARE